MPKFVDKIPDALQRHSGRDIQIVNDEKLGFYRLDPLPSEAELNEIYKEQFAAELRPNFLEKKQQDREFWRFAHQRKETVVRDILGDRCAQPAVLDIGCGVGQLLEDFRDWGWSVQGIEPADAFQPVLQEREIPVIQGMFGALSEEQSSELGSYDFVNLTNVLEHVLDPIGIVEAAVSLVEPGGVLCLETPNDFNDLQIVAAERLQNDPWWLHPLHLNYFDRSSLQRIMENFALEPVTEQAQFPLEFFLLAGAELYRPAGTWKECPWYARCL